MASKNSPVNSIYKFVWSAVTHLFPNWFSHGFFSLEKQLQETKHRAQTSLMMWDFLALMFPRANFQSVRTRLPHLWWLSLTSVCILTPKPFLFLAVLAFLLPSPFSLFLLCSGSHTSLENAWKPKCLSLTPEFLLSGWVCVGREAPQDTEQCYWPRTAPGNSCCKITLNSSKDAILCATTVLLLFHFSTH